MYITALCSTYSFASSHDNDALDAYTCSTMCSTIVMFTPRSTTRSRSAMEPIVSDVTCQPSWMLDVARVGPAHCLVWCHCGFEPCRQGH